ncbi:L-methionine gamma-lyase [bioreactor metagenome]|uniref:L-methionine gamma-lyase n=1 Tax=bioreactor metagenome TaxID=1076179 RepID=A0A645A0R0_9ZZZZ
MKNVKDLGMNSQLVHAGDFEDAFGSAVTPIYQTSTFAFRNAQQGADRFAGREKGFIYSRIGNPTIEALENKLAVMENGFAGIACSSGMGAVSTVYIAMLSSGDHVVSSSAVYGPSRNIMENHFVRFGVQSTYVDTSDLSQIENAIRPNTKLLYIESPANPTMTITDIKAASELAHKHGIMVCVDNTFCSPVLQKPLDLGADIVLHSLTKYINGHADIVGGAIIAKTEETYKKLRAIMVGFGYNMDPHQAYLVIRGAKTLALRVERAQESAMKLAEFLESHPKIERVMYPGLKSHPQYELAQKQAKGPGSMISFEMKGGYEAGVKLMDNVHLIMLAVSLGGVESLIQHPASMTHAGVSAEGKKAAFITEGLVRFSVGIEEAEDILNDLKQALEMV